MQADIDTIRQKISDVIGAMQHLRSPEIKIVSLSEVRSIKTEFVLLIAELKKLQTQSRGL